MALREHGFKESTFVGPDCGGFTKGANMAFATLTSSG